MSNAKEFRCTRNSPYQHECAGQHDVKARQGYYILAESKKEAFIQMAKEFPEDEHGFTADCKEELNLHADLAAKAQRAIESVDAARQLLVSAEYDAVCLEGETSRSARTLAAAREVLSLATESLTRSLSHEKGQVPNG